MKIDSSEMILSGTHSEQVEQESSRQWKLAPHDGWPGFGEMYDAWKLMPVPGKAVLSPLPQIPVSVMDALQARDGAGDKLMRPLIVQMLLDMLEGASTGRMAGLDGCLPQGNRAGRARHEFVLNDAPPDTGFVNLEYRQHDKRTETERTTFSADGAVKTADGRKISLHLSSCMSRQETFESDSCGTVRVEKLKDPLMVNLDGKGVCLTDTRTAFDLEGDGKQEKIPGVAPGSGFLALDANGNGQVDSGLELFGTRSGNGFADLAKLDEDHNQWIDENDSAFGKLRVWSGGEGEQSLETLKQSGIGAIYLGNAETGFSIKGDDGLLGKVRSSGVFLKEDGTSGTVQQIDLAV